MPLIHTKPDMSKLPGGIEVVQPAKLTSTNAVTIEPMFGESAFVIRNLLSAGDCQHLIDLMSSIGVLSSVSVHGRTDIPDAGIGSVRMTSWNEALGNELWRLVQPFVPSRTTNETTATDWWQEGMHRNWKPVAVSPLLRFMRYETGGEHYAHYDAAFIYPDSGFRSLMSIVIYLTTNSDGGATRFVRDNQETRPIWERTHDDWSRPVHAEEVIERVPPVQGSILLFDHRICHDVEPYCGEGPRIIIRGDLIFEKEYGEL